MPELPDLTIFSENLRTPFSGKRIVAVDVVNSKPIAPATTAAFTRSLVGRKITEISRHGKQLVFSLDNGKELWLHLMLHGELHKVTSGQQLPPFTCVTATFTGGSTLALTDRTLWMRMAVIDEGEKPSWASMGIDPLSGAFTLEALSKLLKAKQRSELKSLLMDQKAISGIGNAFADEILWSARLYPRRRAGTLKQNEVQTLHTATVSVLRDAIIKVRKGIHGGFTGEVRGFLSVHGFKGKPCPRCHTPVHFILVGGRGTYYCPTCQKS